MILGIAGLAGSGKDTCGAYLIKEYGFERRAFADPLKKSVAALFDIPFWEVDQLKLDNTVFVAIGYKNEPEQKVMVDNTSGMQIEVPNHMWSPIKEFTFREFLQRYGTESHRDIFGTDFWVNHTLPVGGFYAGRKICVTDLRFVNEVERIQSLGGIAIKLVRDETAPASQRPHRSEQTELLNCNVTIENNGTIEELYEQIDNLLTTYPSED